MTQLEAEILTEGLEELGEVYSIHPEYSGRGMYGRTTVGISVRNPACLLAALAAYVNREIPFPDDFEFPNFQDLARDSMGRGIVIY